MKLYETLVQLYPSVGAQVGRAVALAESGDVDGGLALLDALSASMTAKYQPYWVARAHLLRLKGQHQHATGATLRAIGLSDDSRIRTFLSRQLP